MLIDLMPQPIIEKVLYEEYEYQASIGNVKALFNDASLTYTHLVAIQSDNNLLKFKLQGAAPTQTLVTENTITYPEAFPGVDLRYTTLPDKLKEDILISTKDCLHKFDFDLIESNVEAIFNEDGSITYMNQAGDVVWTVDAPVAYDADDNQLDVVLTYSGTSYSLEVLTDEATIYPIVLDPTITTSTVISATLTNGRVIAQDSQGNWYMVTRGTDGLRLECHKSADLETWVNMNFPVSTIAQSYASIVIDSQDNIYVAWQENVGSYAAIKYSKFNGTTWSTPANIQTITGQGQYNPCMAVDSQDNVHVVWQGTDSSNSSYQIKYSKFNGTSWSNWINIKLISGKYQYDPSIIVDAQDNLHVFWRGVDNNNAYYQIKYSYFNGSVWSAWTNIQTVDNFTQNAPSVAMDSQGYFHVVWAGQNSGSSTNQVKYSTNKSGSWSQWVNIQEISSQNQYYPKIFIDSEDNAHVVWFGYDSANTAKYQIKYSKTESGVWSAWENISPNTGVAQAFVGIPLNSSIAKLPLVWSEGNATPYSINYSTIQLPQSGPVIIPVTVYFDTSRLIESIVAIPVNISFDTVRKTSESSNLIGDTKRSVKALETSLHDSARKTYLETLLVNDTLRKPFVQEVIDLDTERKTSKTISLLGDSSRNVRANIQCNFDTKRLISVPVSILADTKRMTLISYLTAFDTLRRIRSEFFNSPGFASLNNVVLNNGSYKLNSTTPVPMYGTILDNFEGAPKFNYTGAWLIGFYSYPYSGSNVLYSPDIYDGQSTTTQFTVTVGNTGGTLSYYRKTSTQDGYDVFRCSVNNVEKDFMTGFTEWALKTISLQPGLNTIKFTYAKSATISSGSDAVYIDNLQVTNAYLGNSTPEYFPAGYMISNPIDISSIIDNQEIYFSYDKVTPVGTTANLEYSVNGGQTWTHAPHESTFDNAVIQASSLLLKVSLTSNSVDKTPEVSSVKMYVNRNDPSYGTVQITAVFDTKRLSLKPALITADSLRRVKVSDSLIGDSLRRILKTVNIQSDTSRKISKDLQWSLDTLRPISVNTQITTDTSRLISVSPHLIYDTLRFTKKQVQVLSDTSRNAYVNTESILDTIRRVNVSNELTADTIRMVKKDTQPVFDTSRNIYIATTASYDSLRPVFITDISTFDTIRDVYVDLRASYYFDTLRLTKADVLLNLDTERLTKVTASPWFDTKRIAIWSQDWLFDTRRKVENKGGVGTTLVTIDFLADGFAVLRIVK